MKLIIDTGGIVSIKHSGDRQIISKCLLASHYLSDFISYVYKQYYAQLNLTLDKLIINSFTHVTGI